MIRLMPMMIIRAIRITEIIVLLLLDLIFFIARYIRKPKKISEIKACPLGNEKLASEISEFKGLAL